MVGLPSTSGVELVKGALVLRSTLSNWISGWEVFAVALELDFTFLFLRSTSEVTIDLVLSLLSIGGVMLKEVLALFTLLGFEFGFLAARTSTPVVASEAKRRAGRKFFLILCRG